MSEYTTTIAMDREGLHLLIQGFELRVEAGPDRGLSYASTGLVTRIGTHRSNDFVLDDPTVSRFHCEIAVRDGVPVVRDVGSRNGILVDGVPVFEAPLRSGVILTLGQTKLRYDTRDKQARVALADQTSFGLLIGQSAAMRAAFAVLQLAAERDTTVLLQGETGTGKDLAAESLHAASARKDGPLVIVDCGAAQRTLLASELFGHERGAFTGADTTRRGAFESANGGTIFFDEIGELPSDLQPQLLGVLERRTVQRIGGTERIPVDVRVIAATNRNLRTEVNANRFRTDLYYRLAVLEVTLPPLRERLEDIPLLVAHLVEELGKTHEPAGAALLSESSLTELATYRWPGNVRELRNHVERSIASDTPLAVGPDVPPLAIGDEPLRVARDRWIRYFERRFIEELLRTSGGNVTEAAKAAGMARVHLYRLMTRCGLR